MIPALHNASTVRQTAPRSRNASQRGLRRISVGIRLASALIVAAASCVATASDNKKSEIRIIPGKKHRPALPAPPSPADATAKSPPPAAAEPTPGAPNAL